MLKGHEVCIKKSIFNIELSPEHSEHFATWLFIDVFDSRVAYRLYTGAPRTRVAVSDFPHNVSRSRNKRSLLYDSLIYSSRKQNAHFPTASDVLLQ